MAYPEISQENIFKTNSLNDFSNKAEVCLFNFSNLKSSFKLSLSENNSFNYELSKVVHNKLKNEKKDTSWQKDISRYIKKVNIDLPSPKKLLKIENRNKFMNDYNDSFAHFCGLSKDLFIEICLNNKYKPQLNEFGNISVTIKNILDILNNFSSSKRLKATRRMHKKNKKKNIKYEYLKLVQNKPKDKFIITRVGKDEEAKEPEKENENIKLDSNYDNINKDKSNNENISSIVSKNDSESSNKNENKKGKSLLNIKKKLKNISIPTISSKEKSVDSSSSQHIINNQNLNSNNNNNNFNFNNNIMNLSKESKKIASANIENRPFIGPKNIISNQTLSNNLESNNNNIFNFSSNIIQNHSSNSYNKNENDIFGKPPITPFNENNNNNNDLNMSLNHILNDSINRPMLSPLNFPLEYGNIVSPNICHFPKNEMISPFFQNVSPFNNNDMREYFVFNNNFGNNSSFLFGNNINENSNNNGNFINIKNNSNNDNNKEILEQNMNINDKKENNINKNN